MIFDYRFDSVSLYQLLARFELKELLDCDGSSVTISNLRQLLNGIELNYIFQVENGS